MTAVEWYAEKQSELLMKLLKQELENENEYPNMARAIKSEALEMEKQQIEISDEEIGKGRDENIPIDEKEMWAARGYFTIGARWYREQLKQNLCQKEN